MALFHEKYVLQAALKATRAAQFKVDASHDTPQHDTLLQCNCEELVSDLRTLIGPADGMQYPGDTFAAFCSVPHDGYTEDIAREAYDISKQIVLSCENFVG